MRYLEARDCYSLTAFECGRVNLDVRLMENLTVFHNDDDSARDDCCLKNVGNA